MNLAHKAATELIQHASDEVDLANSISTDVHDQNFNMLVSNAFQQFSETDTHYRQVISGLSTNPNLASDPGVLIQLQNYISEYSNYTSLVSTVARKGVSTIETLEKSQ